MGEKAVAFGPLAAVRPVANGARRFLSAVRVSGRRYPADAVGDVVNTGDMMAHGLDMDDIAETAADTTFRRRAACGSGHPFDVPRPEIAVPAASTKSAFWAARRRDGAGRIPVTDVSRVAVTCIHAADAGDAASDGRYVV